MRRRFLVLAFFVAFLVVWFVWNPPGRFGYHTFGFTVYSSIPIPYFDLKIHADGFPSIREKGHLVTLAEVRDLLEEGAEVLVIGTGYDEMVKVEPRVLESPKIPVKVCATPKAIEEFNALKSQGKRVAAIIHTSC